MPHNPSENDPPEGSQRPSSSQEPPAKRPRTSQAFRIPPLPTLLQNNTGPGARAGSFPPVPSGRHLERFNMPGLRAASEVPTSHSGSMRPPGAAPARNTTHIVTQKTAKVISGSSGSSGSSAPRPATVGQQVRDEVASLKDKVAQLHTEIEEQKKELTSLRKQVAANERGRAEDANQAADDLGTLNKTVESLYTLWETDHTELVELRQAMQDNAGIAPRNPPLAEGLDAVRQLRHTDISVSESLV